MAASRSLKRGYCIHGSKEILIHEKVSGCGYAIVVYSAAAGHRHLFESKERTRFGVTYGNRRHDLHGLPHRFL